MPDSAGHQQPVGDLATFRPTFVLAVRCSRGSTGAEPSKAIRQGGARTRILPGHDYGDPVKRGATSRPTWAGAPERGTPCSTGSCTRRCSCCGVGPGFATPYRARCTAGRAVRPLLPWARCHHPRGLTGLTETTAPASVRPASANQDRHGGATPSGRVSHRERRNPICGSTCSPGTQQPRGHPAVTTPGFATATWQLDEAGFLRSRREEILVTPAANVAAVVQGPPRPDPLVSQCHRRRRRRPVPLRGCWSTIDEEMYSAWQRYQDLDRVRLEHVPRPTPTCWPSCRRRSTTPTSP